MRRPGTSAIMTAMGGPIELNGIRLRNRLVTSSSLLGYGASKRRLILY